MIINCRVCGSGLLETPLLQYINMPKAAQFLPDAVSLTQDKGADLDVYQCPGCGLVQLGNAPVPYFREVIRAAAFSEEMRQFRLAQFSDFVRAYSLRGKKVVEIGCGRGEYLTLMKQCGAEVYGLEQSPESVTPCVENGLRVTQGFMDDSAVSLPDSPFDAFFILNFLEHIPDPSTLLRGIGNNLAEGGIGLVEVPNFDMIVRKKLFSEFISDHLLYFTRQTLCTALQLNGFEILDAAEVWHDYIISVVVRKRRKTELSIFIEQQASLRRELGAYIDRFPANKTAIWGAGHQALAVIALTGLAGRVRYVVDSAPFKQGKFTPATHIPIVAPTALETDPVDAVIVMAASYSDEVAKTIRQKSDRVKNIAILRDYGLETVEHS